MKAFSELGADVLFLEAPRSEQEMQRFCEEVTGKRMANMLEGGITPLLSTERLRAIGFGLAAYPLTLALNGRLRDATSSGGSQSRPHARENAQL